MKQYSIMLKPASSLCNLRCRYCFYCDLATLRDVASFGVMSEEVMRSILQNVARSVSAGDRVTFAFQGGEPTMAGLSFFRQFVQAADKLLPGVRLSYALQTNATLLDEQWCRFLKAHDVLVGVSYDILPEPHDAVRMDAGQKPTSERVRQAIGLLEQHHVEYNVLCTLTSQIARHPQQVWKQLVRLDIGHTQFTPCLDELNRPGESVYALTPKRFASFYNTLFPYWLADYRAGHLSIAA